MDSQYSNTNTTSTSSEFVQPQQVKDLLKSFFKGSGILLNKNTQQTHYLEENMAQWHYNEEIPSRKPSHTDQFSSTGTSADSMYGSKTYGDGMYGSEAYSQPDFHDAPLRGVGGETGSQVYNESSSKMGWKATGQSYYDGASFQGGDREMGDQGYHAGSMFGRGSGTSGHSYNDSYVRGRGRGNRGEGSGGNTRGRGRGARGQGSLGIARGRGRGSGGIGPDGSVWGKGHETGGQGSDGGGQGRGRGRGARGYGNYGNAVCGRGSAKRGMPGGGRGSGPSAKKPKWQNEQQECGEIGTDEHRWGAEQGWSREKIWRGRGREQRGRGRGARGKQGGPPQRNNPTHSSQEFDGSAVEYGFGGKLVGPERLSSTYKEYKHCKVCDVHINSMICAKDHYSGKNHLKKLNAILKKEELIKSVDLSSGKCEVCDVVYTSPGQVKSHLEGGRHKKNLEEAKAKAEGRTLPTESTKQKKKEGDKETFDTAGTEKTLSGELPPSDVAPELTKKVVESLIKSSGEVSCLDSRPCDKAKKLSEGAPHKQNVQEGCENTNTQKGKRKPTAAEREAGGRQRQLFHCDLCGINTTSPELLAAHFVGKKHKQKMEFMERKTTMSTATSANVFSCELCGIRATDTYSLNLHLIGKKHMKNLELSKAAQTKQPEPLMASASHPPRQQEMKPPEPMNKSSLPPHSEEVLTKEELIEQFEKHLGTRMYTHYNKLERCEESLSEIEDGGNKELLPEGIAVPQEIPDGIVSSIA